MKKEYCKHCGSPYSGELDEKGEPYFDCCEGVEIDRLRTRINEIRKRIEQYVPMMDYDDIVWFTERMQD